MKMTWHKEATRYSQVIFDKVIKYIKDKGPKQFQYNYNLEIENEKTPKTWKEKLF